MRLRRAGGVIFVNAIVEPRPVEENTFAVLTRAKALIEGHQFDAAIPLYRQVLDRDLSGPLRGEVLTNLGAALCLSVRGRRDAAALAQLNQARDLLTTAIPHRPRQEEPAAWATTRANLALVYLARHEATGSSDDLLASHLALDGAEQALREGGDIDLRDWVDAIRDQLADLRDRRGKRR